LRATEHDHGFDANRFDASRHQSALQSDTQHLNFSAIKMLASAKHPEKQRKNVGIGSSQVALHQPIRLKQPDQQSIHASGIRRQKHCRTGDLNRFEVFETG